MPFIRYGNSPPLLDVKRGVTNVNKVYYGNTLVWTRAPVHYWFDQCGLLPGPAWINETFTAAMDYISDGAGQIVDTAEQFVANLVSFIPRTAELPGIGNIGNLLGVNPLDPEAGICGVLSSIGGTLTDTLKDGIIGFVNGIPIIGGTLARLLDLPSQVTDFNSVIGLIPLVGDMARALGLIPNEDGTWNDPLNLLVDEVGNVLGNLTCGIINVNTVQTTLNFVIGGICDMARLLIPDGLVSLDRTMSRLRYSTLTSGDDGYLETLVGSIGDSGFSTQLFRRFENSGGGGAGVGIDLQDSALSIVRRIGGVDTLVASGGQYTIGDLLRLEQVADTHTLYRNGTLAAAWNDLSATAARGAAFRSTAVAMTGAKEFLGPRRFSPSLVYVEAA